MKIEIELRNNRDETVEMQIYDKSITSFDSQRLYDGELGIYIDGNIYFIKKNDLKKIARFFYD